LSGFAVTALAVATLLAPTAARATPDPAARAPAYAAPSRARLLPSTSDPFRVRGTGFRRGELVRVTVTRIGATTGRTRRVRAGARGTFALAFAGVEPCRGVRGRAVGNRGSRASFTLNSVTC
jgi:hypothetical protein